MQAPNTLRDLSRAEIPAAGRNVEISDNNPPLICLDQLFLDHASAVERVGELETKAAAQPGFVELGDDQTQGALQDVIKEIDKETKILESRREATKVPFLEAGRIIDGFFKSLTDPKGKRQGRLDKARDVLARVATDYLRRKDAAERAKREAEARRLRQIEEDQRAEQRRCEEEAERLRAKHRPGAAVEKETLADVAGHQAEATNAAAIEAEQAANAKPADLARTRSDDGGSLGTLIESWDMNITAFDDLEPERLWPYIGRAEKEKAIRSYMRANAPKEKTTEPWQPLRGVNFFRTTKGNYR